MWNFAYIPSYITLAWCRHVQQCSLCVRLQLVCPGQSKAPTRPVPRPPRHLGALHCHWARSTCTGATSGPTVATTSASCALSCLILARSVASGLQSLPKLYASSAWTLILFRCLKQACKSCGCVWTIECYMQQRKTGRGHIRLKQYHWLILYRQSS